MENAQRKLNSLLELPRVEAWGAGRAPPALDTEAKLANVQWPVSQLFPPEGGAERLGHRAPPAELEDRTDFFIKQLFADTANLYSAEEYVIRTRGRLWPEVARPSCYEIGQAVLAEAAGAADPETGSTVSAGSAYAESNVSRGTERSVVSTTGGSSASGGSKKFRRAVEDLTASALTN